MRTRLFKSWALSIERSNPVRNDERVPWRLKLMNPPVSSPSDMACSPERPGHGAESRRRRPRPCPANQGNEPELTRRLPPETGLPSGPRPPPGSTQERAHQHGRRQDSESERHLQNMRTFRPTARPKPPFDQTSAK